MSETITQEAQAGTTNQSGINPFAEESWTTNPSVSAPEVSVNNDTTLNETTVPAEPVASNNDTAQPETPKNELKEYLGFEKWEDAKAQFEELKKLKETATTQKEIEFANEQSKKLFDLLKEGKEDEVFNFYSEKKKIDKLLASEINEKTAAEMVKMAMKQKYNGASDELIEHKFNKQFGIPKEPVQKDTETEGEFEERHNEWKEKVADIKNDLLFEAHAFRPELEKLKTELKLPEINVNNPSVPYQPTQEELQKLNKYKQDYLQSVDQVLKEFDGFNVAVKDEEVELPITYGLSAEEKNQVSAQLKTLADNNFDVNAIFASRWVNEDNTLNVNRIAKDLALLNNDEKVTQKFVNEAAAKIKLKQVQQLKNTDIKTGESSTPIDMTGGKNPYEVLAESIWGKDN